MRLAAIMMQKNETSLLEHWLVYHARLCGGFENLFIFDDASTDQANIAQLERAIAKGATVIWNNQRRWRLEDKGRLVANFMLDCQHRFDWFLPLDCDEFLCVDNAGTPDCLREAIVDEIERASSDGHDVLRICSVFPNMPHTNLVGYETTKKVIARSTSKRLNLDGGFHMYDWQRQIDESEPNQMVQSRLAHLHFHSRPFLMTLRSAREKLKNRVPDFSPETIRNYNGGGSHLKDYFLISEDEYLGRFGGGPTFDVSAVFASLGFAVPFSEAREPLDFDEFSRLRDPVNPASSHY